MRLFHFSDDPAIARFEPRPARVPSVRPAGLEWLNGPLVWAIDDAHQMLYLFPRDCPRILAWATPGSTAADRARWLGPGEPCAVAFVEAAWIGRLRSAAIHRYELPSETFRSLEDAGMWVSEAPVVPLGCVALAGLDGELARCGVDLCVVDSLVPLASLWESSLHVSGIRLRNSATWALASRRGPR
ncbi:MULTISPECIES: DUF6886 family protein [Inquilinus]|uniref:DUF4433 domain-containing protein n=1 Tax=Inquilinus ginsengisoli TaxID=363840 RepID=A0ABU1JVF7_9PROT|nr:DUF6886 family protein [Inquilinus ginsengisoli]MDR6292272.1 hypothetical protein [Inquilinus ginsengisoli]